MNIFYKIVKGNGPFYLSSRVVFKDLARIARSSRSLTKHNMPITEPFCRLTCYKTSFFPECIRVWNSLTSTAVNSASIDVFNSQLLILPEFASIVNLSDALQYNKVLKGHNGRLLTQFRLGLSPLRNELFTYNITDNPFCQACGEDVETLSHYMFVCASYTAQRTVFMNNIIALINAININLHLSLDSTDQNVLTRLITCGVYLPNFDYDVVHNVNTSIFNIASSYISATTRFMNNH